MAKVGYIRCSSPRSKGYGQENVIGAVEQLYREVCSGHREDKPVLTQIIGRLKRGDTLVVSTAERLSRRQSQLRRILKKVWHHKANVKIMTYDGEPIELNWWMHTAIKEKNLLEAMNKTDCFFQWGW